MHCFFNTTSNSILLSYKLVFLVIFRLFAAAVGRLSKLTDTMGAAVYG